MNNDEKVLGFYNSNQDATEESSGVKIKKDDSIDLNAIIKAEKEKEDTPTVKKALTPLEQMQLEKEKNTGMIISNEELEKGKERTEMRNPIYNDRRMQEIKDYLDDMDLTYEKRKHVVVTQFPQINTPEYMEMIEEIESLKKDEDGNYYFDLRDNNGDRVEPKYVRLRTKDDPEYVEGKTEYPANQPEEKPVESEKKEETNEETKKIVQVLIDKTGLGINVDFTEEEKEKIYESQEIRLTEVEFVDIESILMASTPTTSVKEGLKEFELTNSKTTICFPCSGYRAQMKGMTYGELGDVSLMMDSVTYDQYYKRLSVMYNNMTNVSTGPFEDFEDFLKKTAYTDIPMGLYGMYVATQPEIQAIRLECGDEKCKKNFDWKFNTRSLLRLEKCTKKFLDNMSRIANASPFEFKTIQKEAPVNNSKFIKLPISNIIVEMGIISCYEFLNNLIPVLDEKTFEDNFGDSKVYANNVLLLTAVRSVILPKRDGGTVRFTNYKDILDALYLVKSDEVKIIASVASKLTAEYQSVFAFNNVVCPHCGAKTESLEVSMDDLVFRTYQQSMTTEINVENMHLS